MKHFLPKPYHFIWILTLVLLVLIGCKDEDSPTVEVPVPDFEVSQQTVLTGDEVQFTDLSSNDPVSWKWFFGDGNTSTEQNPTHTYELAGSYSVFLEATNEGGSQNVTKENYMEVVDILTSNPKSSDFDIWVDDNVMSVYDNPDYTGISIAFIENGTISKYNYGVKERETYDLADDNTLYQIASITKTFTGLAVIQWLNENEISLDESVIGYLPSECASGLSLNDTQVTFRHLLNHTSGLPRNSFSLSNNNCTNSWGDSTDVYNYLSSHSLSRTPGTLPTNGELFYSNFGFAVLGTILERQTKSSLQELYGNYIFNKIGLSSTTFALPSSQDNIALPYGGINGGSNSSCNEIYDILEGAYESAGGLLCNLDDLSNYVHTMLSGSDDNDLNNVIDQTLENQYSSGNDLSVALPWQITEASSGEKIYEHGGGLSGMSSYIGFNRDKNRAVVFMTNYWITDNDWLVMVNMARNYIASGAINGRIEIVEPSLKR